MICCAENIGFLVWSGIFSVDRSVSLFLFCIIFYFLTEKSGTLCVLLKHCILYFPGQTRQSPVANSFVAFDWKVGVFCKCAGSMLQRDLPLITSIIIQSVIQVFWTNKQGNKMSPSFCRIKTQAAANSLQLVTMETPARTTCSIGQDHRLKLCSFSFLFKNTPVSIPSCDSWRNPDLRESCCGSSGKESAVRVGRQQKNKYA